MKMKYFVDLLTGKKDIAGNDLSVTFVSQVIPEVVVCDFGHILQECNCPENSNVIYVDFQARKRV